MKGDHKVCTLIRDCNGFWWCEKQTRKTWKLNHWSPTLQRRMKYYGFLLKIQYVRWCLHCERNFSISGKIFDSNLSCENRKHFFDRKFNIVLYQTFMAIVNIFICLSKNTPVESSIQRNVMRKCSPSGQPTCEKMSHKLNSANGFCLQIWNVCKMTAFQILNKFSI